MQPQALALHIKGLHIKKPIATATMSNRLPLTPLAATPVGMQRNATNMGMIFVLIMSLGQGRTARVTASSVNVSKIHCNS